MMHQIAVLSAAGMPRWHAAAQPTQTCDAPAALGGGSGGGRSYSRRCSRYRSSAKFTAMTGSTYCAYQTTSAHTQASEQPLLSASGPSKPASTSWLRSMEAECVWMRGALRQGWRVRGGRHAAALS